MEISYIQTLIHHDKNAISSLTQFSRFASGLKKGFVNLENPIMLHTSLYKVSLTKWIDPEEICSKLCRKNFNMQSRGVRVKFSHLDTYAAICSVITNRSIAVLKIKIQCGLHTRILHRQEKASRVQHAGRQYFSQSSPNVQ